MTETQKKALALVNEGRGNIVPLLEINGAKRCLSFPALCRAIEELEAEKAARAADHEQHEAYRQEVSDAVEGFWNYCRTTNTPFPADLDRFIIAKPVDPLVEVMRDCGFIDIGTAVDDIRAALAARGLKIVEDK